MYLLANILFLDVMYIYNKIAAGDERFNPGPPSNEKFFLINYVNLENNEQKKGKKNNYVCK